MRVMLNLALHYLLMVTPFATAAQDTPDLLPLYIKEIRAGKYPSVPRQLIIAENSANTLDRVIYYLKDTTDAVRAKVYGLIHLAGTNARTQSVRQNAVAKLLEAANDNHSGNARIAIEYLYSFFREDFDEAAKEDVRGMLDHNTINLPLVIKLVGFLGLSDVIGKIREFTTSKNPKHIRWAAILCLTRLGDQSAEHELIVRIRKLPVSDELIYGILPDVVYSRSRMGFDYMIELLQSDEKKCQAADAEHDTQIACGYRIMEQLAPVVRDYPLQLDESGDIRSDDYLASLAAVRYWFSKNKHYEIITESF